MLLVPVIFFLWRVDYALKENVLTEQMWFLPLISYWEVVTCILIFCCYCLWSAWFALWCKSIFFSWPLLSSKTLQCGYIRVWGCLISPAIASRIWIILSYFLFGRECDGFLHCFVTLGSAVSIFSRIVISKSRRMENCNVTQSWLLMNFYCRSFFWRQCESLDWGA